MFKPRTGSIPLTGRVIKVPVVDPAFGTHKIIILSRQDDTIIGHPSNSQPALGKCQCWLHANARSLAAQGYALAYSISLGAVCLVKTTSAVSETHFNWFGWTNTIHTLKERGGGLIVRSGFFPNVSRAKQPRDQDITQFFQYVLTQRARIQPK